MPTTRAPPVAAALPVCGAAEFTVKRGDPDCYGDSPFSHWRFSARVDLSSIGLALVRLRACSRTHLMKVMTRRHLCLIWLILCIGCKPAPVYYQKARSVTEQAKVEIAKALKPGSSELEIAGFLRRQGWLFDYDDFENRFVAVVYRTPDQAQAVTAYIYVDEAKRMTRSDVQIVIRGL